MLNLPTRRFPELINHELMIRRVPVLQPMLLLMEEPSLGVSPGLLTKALEAIREINVE